MKIIKQLADLDTVEVSSHGLQESYFEPTAAQSCSTTSAPSATPTTTTPSPAPTTTPSPAPEVHKQHVILEASTVQGTLQGMASGEMMATLHDIDNEPIPGQEIIFIFESTRQELGRGVTNADGVAKCETGSNISNIQGMFSGATSGYRAMYKGSKQYYPAEAKGKFNVSI